jgi:predicted regulator of Ras-like GTPase activity (Roadblock/LC7/MglB family)
MEPTMTVHAYQISAEAQQFNWLLGRFATETAGVREAIAVSTDGLLIAMSSTLNRPDADRLAAITSAITSLANGASRVYDLGPTNKVIIDLDQGYVLVSAISPASMLGVLAGKEANLGNLAYDMAMFANRAGGVLTPQLIDELKTTLRA